MFHEITNEEPDQFPSDSLVTLEEANLKVEAVMEHVIEEDGRLEARIDALEARDDRQDARMEDLEATVVALRQIAQQLLSERDKKAAGSGDAPTPTRRRAWAVIVGL